MRYAMLISSSAQHIKAQHRSQVCMRACLCLCVYLYIFICLRVRLFMYIYIARLDSNNNIDKKLYIYMNLCDKNRLHACVLARADLNAPRTRN